MKITRTHLLATAVLLLSGLVALAYQTAARPRTAAPASMAALLPQGALLTIESQDFGALLHDWNASPQQKAWLASDNHAVFSNSRLFGRLHDAQEEFFANAFADKSPDAPDLLTQVAGKQSIFAWYDVGKLEFLYITRLSSAQISASALVAARGRFSARQAGGQTFYIRKSNAAAVTAESAQGKARTVAFAEVEDSRGAMLILATREDLIANALELIARTKQAPDSVAQEEWFKEASAALAMGRAAPVLHMVLNLDRLVPLPYFRSYWVQQNVTTMSQYRAAVSDLYREERGLREERVLLLKAADATTAQVDLATLAELAPAASGVYRATATSDADDALGTLEDKLLGRAAVERLPATGAPDPGLDAGHAGSTSDLETRIDAPALVSTASSNHALTDAVRSAGFDAMLTYSTALPPETAESLWVPMHSAVVLHATSGWKPETLQAALQQSLRGSLTTSTLGIAFTPETAAGQTVYRLNGPKPLFFATVANAAFGNLCIVSDDGALLLAMLQRAASSKPAAGPGASLIAGFDHGSQRAPFARLTGLIDGTNQSRGSAQRPQAPAFFSGNVRSLSDAFAPLASERIVERREGANLRQTVTYEWQQR